MCGIALIAGEGADHIQRMVGRLAHRGPGGAGVSSGLLMAQLPARFRRFAAQDADDSAFVWQWVMAALRAREDRKSENRSCRFG